MTADKRTYCFPLSLLLTFSLTFYATLALFEFGFVQPAQALIQELKLGSDQTLNAQRWILDPQSEGHSKADGKQNELLKELKLAEIKGDVETCLRLVKTIKPQPKSLAPWILNSGVNCAAHAKLPSVKSLLAQDTLIALAEKQIENAAVGPQSTLFKDGLIQAGLSQLENDVRGNRSGAWEKIERLEGKISWMDEKARGKYYRLVGELCFIQQKLDAALQYLRRALKEGDSDDLRARIEMIEKSIGRKESSSNASGQNTESRIESSAEELALYDRITVSLKAGDLMPALEDAGKLILKFPGGTRAKWATDRILEAYLSVADKSDSKYLLLKEEMLKIMGQADPERVSDWAKTLNARGYFEPALRLALKAARGLDGSVRSTKAYETAAHVAYSLERYEEAQKYHNELILRHAGTPAARESLLRSAFIHFRLAEYSLAASDLERLLAAPQSESFELIARYWLWRAQQKSGSDRAVSQRDLLIEKFPFSYYGLRARIEKNNGMLSIKSGRPIHVVSSQWVTDRSRAQWERITALLSAGWLAEAQAELKELPAPLYPEDKAIRARYLAAALHYGPVVKLLGEAWDESSELREEPFLSVGFPSEFSKAISAEASKQNVPPNLVRGLIRQESAFEIRALSSSSAMGLMQMIPPTAKEIAGELKLGSLQIPDDLYVPPLNIQMGTYYLGKLVKKYQGHIPLALAAYNSGPTAVDRFLKSRPSLAKLTEKLSSEPIDELWIDEYPYQETRSYVKAILRNQLIYRALEQDQVEIKDRTW